MTELYIGVLSVLCDHMHNLLGPDCLVMGLEFCTMVEKFWELRVHKFVGKFVGHEGKNLVYAEPVKVF